MAVTSTPPAGVPTSSQSIQDVGTSISAGDNYMSAFEAAGQAAKNDTAAKPAVETPQTPAASETPETPASPETPLTDQTPDPLETALETVSRSRRDYSGLDEDEVKIFKNMSRESYEKLRPIYDAHKKSAGFDPKKLSELETETESLRKFRYADHPRAFELSEEYSQAKQIVDNISTVSNFWEQQFIAAESGQPISLLQRDSRGVLVPTQPQQPTPQLKAEILRHLNKTSADLQSAQREVEGLATSYKANFDEYGRVLGDIHGKLFGKYEADLKPAAEKYLNQFPSFARHKPEVKLAAYALAALSEGSKSTISAKNKTAAENAVKAAATAAGPTSASIKAGATKPGRTDITEADYHAFKANFSIR